MFCEIEDSSSACSPSGLSNVSSLSFLSVLGKSNAAPPPGVLGVFAEPNEANAPLPSPNAEDAPTDGDLLADGERVLKGLVLPCDDVSPNRLPENVRGESSLAVSFPS